METTEDKNKKEDKAEEKRIIPPLTITDEKPPARNDEPAEEFIDQKSNKSKNQS